MLTFDEKLSINMQSYNAAKVENKELDRRVKDRISDDNFIIAGEQEVDNTLTKERL